MKRYLFLVKYVGKSNNYFTKDKIYKVIHVDEDGDYVLIDDFYNEMLHYKSKFVKVE
ncbi:hypothetical protein [Sporosalibacterium faouarense]|uniref:hypothetical protein n=1 Tax=Sporosalibacterium faouarense TaxID=516123 RepID=UPI00192BFEF4|nr:hypothetical protein [Sporosalibacterium faouarense]